MSVVPAQVAPTSVSYATPSALYFAGEAITPNTASLIGGTGSVFTVAPALPDGLSIDAQTGAISGTASSAQTAATYTVTAANTAGSVQTQLHITISAHNSWSLAAPLSSPQADFATTLLHDGRVMIAGGYNNADGVLSSVSIYDPSLNTWMVAAPMLQPREWPSATVLQDGRVLVSGGYSPGGIRLSSCEIYDPTTNSWQATGSLNEGLTSHVATLLPNGKVLVVGGTLASGAFTAGIEEFDPATNLWTRRVHQLSQARTQHTGLLLADGSAVLVAGGAGVLNAELVPLTDAATTVLPSIPLLSGSTYSSVLLSNGMPMVIADAGNATWLGDASAMTWTAVPLSGYRSNLAIAPLKDGRALVAGGSGVLSTEFFDPATNAWTLGASMNASRVFFGLVTLADGRVMAIGGRYGVSGILSSTEIYAP